MNPAIGYFLTWGCHGTRLHGDARGTVDRFNNSYNSPTIPADPEREEFVQRRMTHQPYRLGPERCSIVRQTIVDHATFRRWKLHAVHPRTEHVHVVVSAARYTPEVVMDQFKSWCTRRLRAASELERDRPAWATHGSTVYLWDQEQLGRAVTYVIALQGEPMA